MRLALVAVVALLASCRTADVQPLSSNQELNRFARQVESAIEAHDWDQIIEMSDREIYREKVVEHGMPEPQFVAELFGLHRTGNNIETDGRPSRADLARIEAVELESIDTAPTPHLLHGSVTLSDGSTLDLEARIAPAGDRWVLTAARG